jgi:hypothetical protein
VWRSVNGSRWESVDWADFHDDGYQRMSAVTAFADLLVAVGWDDSDAAAWSSSDDGLTWTQATSPDLAARGPQRMRDLAVVGSQLIAVGSSGAGDKADAAAWVSVDGLEWTRMDPASFVRPGRQQMWGAHAAGTSLVAVGFSNELGSTDAAVWTYEATVWTSAGPSVVEEPGQQVMLDVAGGGQLPFVAVGCEDPDHRCDAGLAPESDAAVWVSDDGLSWQRVATEEGKLAAPGRQVMRAVVVYHGAFVAAGTRVAPSDNDGGVWASVDGHVWEATTALDASALGGKGDQSIRSLLVYGRHGFALLGFGVTNQGANENAHVWTARLAE